MIIFITSELGFECDIKLVLDFLVHIVNMIDNSIMNWWICQVNFI